MYGYNVGPSALHSVTSQKYCPLYQHFVIKASNANGLTYRCTFNLYYASGDIVIGRYLQLYGKFSKHLIVFNVREENVLRCAVLLYKIILFFFLSERLMNNKILN